MKYTHNTIYTTSIQHHMYTILHMLHVHITIGTIIEYTTCTTYHTTIVLHIHKPHIYLTKNLASVVKPAPEVEEKRYQRLIIKPLQGGNLHYIT